MKKKLTLILAALGGAALLLLLPLVHAALVAANLLIHFIVLGLQLVTARLPRARPARKEVNDQPFVSIQVPAYNEPPAVLAETLRDLSRLRWENYEVIVVDNNTRDETVWRPIESLCEKLGPRFRFFHIENMRGAKAGALNWVRQFMDPRAEFVFVVDADYQVNRNALKRALSYVTSDDIGLVQFPQDYRNIGPGNAGLALDFKHFFTGYMNMANQLGCVPSTGTLSLISVKALRAVSGFNTSVVTEDAEIGLRMNMAGFRSVYANEVIGQGLMPHDLESLKKQRWRWAFGNAQILRLNWRQLLLCENLTWRQKIGYLVHLTAWFNFNLIPSLSLVLLAPLAWLDRMHPLQPFIVVVSGFTLATFMVLRFGTLLYSLRKAGYPLREIWLAFLTHLGLGWIFSASWINCLFSPRAPFVRTNKFLLLGMPGVLRAGLVEISFGCVLLVTAITLTLTDFVIGPIAALLMATSRFLVLWVGRQVRHTFDVTERLQNDIERRTEFRHPEKLLAVAE